MAAYIANWMVTAPTTDNIYREVYSTIATLSGTALIGNPDIMAQRLEELTGILGRLAEADVNNMPALGIALNNINAIGDHIKNMEFGIQARIKDIEEKCQPTRHHISAKQQNPRLHKISESWARIRLASVYGTASS